MTNTIQIQGQEAMLATASQVTPTPFDFVKMIEYGLSPAIRMPEKYAGLPIKAACSAYGTESGVWFVKNQNERL